jgi:hypothetical protein
VVIAALARGFAGRIAGATLRDDGRTMEKGELLDAIFEEIQRIFGFESYPSREQIPWLTAEYGISLEEHLRYELILDDEGGDLAEKEPDEESLAFVHDEEAVLRFLQGLLQKYRSGTAVYPANVALFALERARRVVQREK